MGRGGEKREQTGGKSKGRKGEGKERSGEGRGRPLTQIPGSAPD